MILNLPRKPTLDEFIRTCTPLAIIDELEIEMQKRVESIVAALGTYQTSANPVENLANFLKADADFLGVILSLTKLSQEKFLRILSAERFAQGDFGREWSSERIYRKLRDDEQFAIRIAKLFLEGRKSSLLVRQVASFYLNQLALPNEWDEIIRDTHLVQNVVRAKLSGAYTDKKGDVIENLIRNKLNAIEAQYGISHEKGQIRYLGKEVDHAIPTLEDTHIMIMSSYMETTSSHQTARANEQREMYLKIVGQNSRYNEQRILINFVDGAGWLARRSDLRKLHTDCHYILNLQTLDLLEPVVCRFVPEQFFTKQARPQVIED
jgi:hypothetical protein